MRSPDPAPIPARYERLLGDKAGLVTNVQVRLPERGSPGSPTPSASTPAYGVLDGVIDEADVGGGGKQSDVRRATLAALGETVERYASSIAPRREELTRASYRQLARDESVVEYDYLVSWGQDRTDVEDAVALVSEPPGDKRVSSEERLFSRAVECFWLPGKNLLTGDVTYVPAQLASWAVPSHYDVPTRWRQTTNGRGTGPTVEFALAAALTEVIERDAVLTAWLLQREPTPIDVSPYPEIEALVAETENDRYSVHTYELPSEVDIPVVGCSIVNDRDEYLKFAVAGNAAPSPGDALRGAIRELHQVFPLQITRESLQVDGIDMEETVFDDFEKNVHLYGQPEYFDAVQIFVNDEDAQRTALAEYEQSTPASERPDLQRLLEAAANANLTPIALDLTPRDIEEAGLTVVRVVVPELVPFATPSFPPVYHPKLAGKSLETRPHPFP